MISSSTRKDENRMSTNRKTIYLLDKLQKQVAEQAVKENRSFSQMVRIMLEQALKLRLKGGR